MWLLNKATVVFRSALLYSRGRRGQSTGDLSRTDSFVSVLRSNGNQRGPSGPRQPPDLRDIASGNNALASRAYTSAGAAGQRLRNLLALPLRRVYWEEGNTSFTRGGFRVDRQSRLGSGPWGQRSRPLERGKTPGGRWKVDGWSCRAWR